MENKGKYETGKKPESVNDLFPSKWLHADDLQGKTALAVVEGVEVEQMRDYETHEPVWKACLKFVGKDKMLVLNKTQALSMASIAGSERFEDWKGRKVALSAGRAKNGKQTVVIRAASS